MDFKEKLVFVRAKLNFSQEELGKELGMSFATINRWETGRTSPTKRGMMVFITYCKERGIKFDE